MASACARSSRTVHIYPTLAEANKFAPAPGNAAICPPACWTWPATSIAAALNVRRSGQTMNERDNGHEPSENAVHR